MLILGPGYGVGPAGGPGRVCVPMSQRWRALQHVIVSPPTIVLTQFEHKMISRKLPRNLINHCCRLRRQLHSGLLGSLVLRWQYSILPGGTAFLASVLARV